MQTKICKARGAADPEVLTPSHSDALTVVMPADAVAVNILITLQNSINWPLFVTLVIPIVIIIDEKTETQTFFFNLPHVTLLIMDRAKIDSNLVNKVVKF